VQNPIPSFLLTTRRIFKWV